MWHPEAHDGLLKEDTSGFVQHSKWPAAAGVATHCSMHSVKPADGAAVATRRSTTTRQASTSAVPRRSILDVQQAGWLYPGAGVGILEYFMAVMQLLQRVLPLTQSHLIVGTRVLARSSTAVQWSPEGVVTRGPPVRRVVRCEAARRWRC